jgi:predicted anti-sigma-YlaC factor YlaD
MRCDDLREKLRSYLEDSLSEEERHILRRHLRECASCRSWAVGIDPTLLFVAAEPPRAEPDEIERCTEGVLGLIHQERLSRRLRSRKRPWLAAAAALLVAVGAVSVWRVVATGDHEVVPSGVGEAADPLVEAPPPPQVDVDMPGEGVRVYQYADERRPDTVVYYVVNPALES